jgi:hypothetical protein
VRKSKRKKKKKGKKKEKVISTKSKVNTPRTLSKDGGLSKRLEHPHKPLFGHQIPLTHLLSDVKTIKMLETFKFFNNLLNLLNYPITSKSI